MTRNDASANLRAIAIRPKDDKQQEEMQNGAVFYERNGPAGDVLKLGEFDTPRAGPGEVRIKLATSGVNPSDVKARSGSTRKIAYPRVIPQRRRG